MFMNNDAFDVVWDLEAKTDMAKVNLANGVN